MISASRIKWIGILLLLMMAVRVSITPGIQHQHAGGDRPHTHHPEGAAGHAGHSHPHSPGSQAHSHAEVPPDPGTNEIETGQDQAHIHVSLFGWELTLSSPWDDDPSAAETSIPASRVNSRQAKSLPAGVSVTSASSWGTLIQFLIDLRSPAPPSRLKLPQENHSDSLPSPRKVCLSRDRDRPLLPPPERVIAVELTC